MPVAFARVPVAFSRIRSQSTHHSMQAPDLSSWSVADLKALIVEKGDAYKLSGALEKKDLRDLAARALPRHETSPGARGVSGAAAYLSKDVLVGRLIRGVKRHRALLAGSSIGLSEPRPRVLAASRPT